ncbi:MAG: hypothetical protein C0594_14420 [Marinilabiliales bacterium]|nr:MAG: hypothetical protein C0594_14420 [Marinilabiliales bacterium]
MKHLPIINHTYQKLHNEFTRFITTKGYSRGKDVMYPTCIREFLFFIENKGVETIQNVDANTIQSYYYYISSRPNQRRAGGLSDSMLKTHLYSLRLFFDYLLDTDVLEYSPARLPKFTLKKSEQREILSNDQIRKLYTVCESYRDKALLSAAYGCGLRRSEMVNLDLEDVIFHKGIVIVRDSKNHKNRTIPMSDFVARHLKEYIVNERTKGLINNRKINNSFFVSNTGNRWRGNNMNDRLHYLV